MATREQQEKAWQDTPRVPDKNPNLYRRDVFGNEIYKPAYGKMGTKS